MTRRFATSTRTIAMLGAGALAATLLLTEPGAAGLQSEKLKARVARRADGPYKTATRLNLDAGEVKNAYMKVKSVTGEAEPATLEQTLFPASLSIKFFTKGGTEITEQVETPDGYPFTAKPRKFKRFRIRVKELAAAEEACFFPQAEDDSKGFALVSVTVNRPISDCT